MDLISLELLLTKPSAFLDISPFDSVILLQSKVYQIFVENLDLIHLGFKWNSEHIECAFDFRDFV